MRPLVRDHGSCSPDTSPLSLSDYHSLEFTPNHQRTARTRERPSLVVGLTSALDLPPAGSSKQPTSVFSVTEELVKVAFNDQGLALGYFVCVFFFRNWNICYLRRWCTFCQSSALVLYYRMSHCFLYCLYNLRNIHPSISEGSPRCLNWDISSPSEKEMKLPVSAFLASCFMSQSTIRICVFFWTAPIILINWNLFSLWALKNSPVSFRAKSLKYCWGCGFEMMKNDRVLYVHKISSWHCTH